MVSKSIRSVCEKVPSENENETGLRKRATDKTVNISENKNIRGCINLNGRRHKTTATTIGSKTKKIKIYTIEHPLRHEP